MRVLKLSILMLAMSVRIGFADDNAVKDNVVKLELRPVGEIGAQATAITGPAGEPAVEVVGGDAASTTELMAVDSPPISSHQYVVRGRIKYSGVVGDGYLELWNDFGEKGAFFTRSLSDWGGLKKLNGTSDWRAFELPFHAEPGMKPKRLTLNLVLPGAGKVAICQSLVLAPLSSSSEWWTMPQSGLIGGLFGSLAGILGAVIGVSASWGKSRVLTMTACRIGLAIGSVSLVTGIVAVCLGQPYHVYYPLLLIGLIDVCVLGFNIPNISRRFQEDELRRIHAADAV